VRKEMIRPTLTAKLEGFSEKRSKGGNLGCVKGNVLLLLI
jgi:hypothetical protein